MPSTVGSQGSVGSVGWGSALLGCGSFADVTPPFLTWKFALEKPEARVVFLPRTGDLLSFFLLSFALCPSFCHL